MAFLVLYLEEDYTPYTNLGGLFLVGSSFLVYTVPCYVATYIALHTAVWVV